MYLVELRPGKEELYRTTEELAAAIRSGDVDAQSRIYHRATSKWISVTLHPQYKAIVSERTPLPPPTPPLRTNWTFFNDSADSLAGAQDPDPDQNDGPGSDPNHPWRRPLALSITGGLLILGLQLAASGPKPPWASTESHPKPAETVRPAAAPAPVQTAPQGVSSASLPPSAAPASDASPTISLVTAGASWTELNRGYVASGDAETVAPPPVAPAVQRLPAAPLLRPKALLRAITPATVKQTASGQSVLGFLQRWSVAQDSALNRLESGMRVARLDNLFATDRLSPAGGVTETRMSLAGVANFVRIYRQQQAAIDRRFQDSFAVAAKANGWTPADAQTWNARRSRLEGPAMAGLTSSLIQGIDSLLGVLDAQAGTYRLTSNAIHFEDPAAAREYMVLRERIAGTLDSAKAEGAADRPGPMGYLLDAIGSTRLPIGI